MKNEAIEISKISIFINIILSLLKLMTGIIGNSIAMISDAIHSISDVFSTIVVIVGIKLASKEEDKEHPYGHEKLECVAAIILSIMLLFVGLLLGKTGISNITNKTYLTLTPPSIITLIMAIVSVLSKEIMFQMTIKVAKETNSNSLKADAWHHRSDALSSIGSGIGILFAMNGFPMMDSIASIIICLFIIKVSIEIFIDTIRKMIDESIDEEQELEIKNLISKKQGIKRIDSLKTRKFGSKIYIDLEVSIDKELKLYEAHEIVEQLHDEIENAFKDIKHCMIHMNPY